MTVQKIEFSVESISFFSPCFDSIDSLAEGKPSSIDQKNHPLIKQIPMMLRRRLLSSDRYSVALGLFELNKINDHSKIAKIIYASRVGETIKCLTILKSLLNHEPASPTDFSGSVQNANVGIVSIASKFHGETTAISAAENTLYSALIEAYITLKHIGDPEYKVIVVAYEDSLTNDLMEIEDNFNGPYALSMVLSIKQENVYKPEKCLVIDDRLINITTLYFAKNYRSFLQ